MFYSTVVEFNRSLVGYRSQILFSALYHFGKIKVPILFSGFRIGCNVFGTVETKMTIAKGHSPAHNDVDDLTLDTDWAGKN